MLIANGSLSSWDVFNGCGTIASIISLFIAVYTLWQVSALSKHFQRRVLLPSILGRLRAIQSNIEIQLPNRELSNLKREMSRMEAVLNNIGDLSSGRLKKTAVSLAKMKIASISRNTTEQTLLATVEQITIELPGLVEEVQGFLESARWQPNV